VTPLPLEVMLTVTVIVFTKVRVLIYVQKMKQLNIIPATLYDDGKTF
jgi:hypothetical protein